MFSTFAVVVALACGTSCGSMSPAPGTRGDCAEGGVLNAAECPPLGEVTPYSVCDKAVTCGVIVRDSHDNGNDYESCINRILQHGDDGTADFIMECIAASSCDQLETGYCFELGEN